MSKLRGFISGNQLKIIALISMTCDHVGKQIYPQQEWLQIVGRLAFPIFAYMVAEGCFYTKNRTKYLGTMAAVALLCQVVYLGAMGSLYQSVLVTFTLAIVLIYAIDWAKLHRNILGVWALVLGFGFVWFCSVGLPMLLKKTDYGIDYGLAGILLVAGIYLVKDRGLKLIVATVFLCILGLELGGIQWYGLLALIPLALYNGKRGKMRLKYLFYIYYPAHLACIYLLSLIF